MTIGGRRGLSASGEKPAHLLCRLIADALLKRGDKSPFLPISDASSIEERQDRLIFFQLFKAFADACYARTALYRLSCISHWADDPRQIRLGVNLREHMKNAAVAHID